MSNMRQIDRCFRWLVLLVVISAAACTGEGQPSNGQAAQVAPTSTSIPTAPAIARPTYTVQRGDVQDILPFSGRWQPRDQVRLAFEIAGTIRRVEVERGDAVTAGQLLADLQITDLENQLASAQLELETAQSGLEAGAEGSIQSVADAEVALANARLQLQSAEANRPWASVASARIALDAAELDVENAQRAYDEAISRPEQDASIADNAYIALQSAQNRLRSAEASYFQASQAYNNHEFQIAQNENGVIAAELALSQARQGGGDASGVQTVRAAQLRIDQINADIRRSSLYAPLDGEVLEVMIVPGEAVTAFGTVITIGRPEPKEAIASLPLADAQRLSVGLVGVCQVINQPDTAVQCIVRQIPLSASDADQTTRVAASLEGVPSGQLIEVQMPLQVRPNVLWLPPPAIRTFQGRTFVVLETAEGPRAVDVQIGLQTDEQVEIVAGVNEGDVVVGP